MNNHLIPFEGMAWENPSSGVRQKVFLKEGKRLRLVEFSEEFVEEGWCEKGHAGFVVEGRIWIEFKTGRVEFQAGDGLFISEGDAHRASVAKGEKAVLVLFEKA